MLAVVIIITIAAHVWMYRWLRYKMDEGAILHCLQDTRPETLSTLAIAEHTGISSKRVAAVCHSSEKINMASQSDHWAAL